jgi:hypothetical protein
MNEVPDAALSEPRLRLIVDSYRHLTGRRLLAIVPDAARELALALWQAPRAIVAHDSEADPIFFYGNRRALQLFEMDFAEFTRLPSRLSTEAPARAERSRLLQEVTMHGYVDNYAGMRIAKSGRRFLIENGIVWNLVNAAGVCHGQAATFDVR